MGEAYLRSATFSRAKIAVFVRKTLYEILWRQLQVLKVPSLKEICHRGGNCSPTLRARFFYGTFFKKCRFWGARWSPSGGGGRSFVEAPGRISPIFLRFSISFSVPPNEVPRALQKRTFEDL